MVYGHYFRQARAILLASSILTGAAPSMAAPAPPPGIVVPPVQAPAATVDASPDIRALHLLDRITFGPNAADLAHLRAVGIDRFIDEQLAPQTLPLPPDLKARLDGLETLKLDTAQLWQLSRVPGLAKGEKPTEDQKKEARQRENAALEQSMEARLLRAVYSPRQLQEVMVDFWYNHFNVASSKNQIKVWVGNYEATAIRPYALGRFRDLLEATARHPAMLVYLDNEQNIAPESGPKNGNAKGLNENFAREVMELHTLGVDGGYTQNDVIALARILTGWRLIRQEDVVGAVNGFIFDAKHHDYGDKVFLGQTIKGSGIQEGEIALDMLARSPKTAHHLAFQLAQYFVADQPDPALVDQLAKRYLETDGNIRAVMKTLLTSPQFRDPSNLGVKYKTPLQYVVSSIRLAGTPVVNVRPVAGTLHEWGEALYGCATPDGYKNTTEAWLSPDALDRRIGFATALAADRFPVDRVPDQKPQPQPTPVAANDLLAVIQPELSGTTIDAINSAPPALQAALVLGSPEFLHH
jgi:uncharacterized protein (DUF1800 family)